MSTGFVLSAQAEQDIDDIAAYIARDSVEVALRFYDAAWETCSRLASAPNLGKLRIVEAPELQGLRSTSVDGFKPFIVFYIPAKAGIRILRVLHGARDIETLFPT